MAASLLLKRAKILELFSQRFFSKTFCASTATSPANVVEDVSAEKKEKKKDLAKMAAYEDYRTNVKSITGSFKEEYKRMKAKERQRLEEINQGRFSPYEQHKKAVEDITKYNENKEKTRKNQDEAKERRMRMYCERQKEASNAKERERKRALLLKVIEESKSFVTFENLEEKIQEVLSKETNYNFAITADGRKLFSKEPPSNLGMPGPGPLAYQGQRLLYKYEDSWKTRRKLDNDTETSDLSDNESGDSDSSDSDSSDSDSSDDDTRR